MAYWSLITYTRPNTDTAWYSPGSNVNDLVTNSKNAGNITSYETSESGDNLKKYYKIGFKDEATLTAFTENSTYLESCTARDTYCANNSITFVKEIYGDTEPTL